MLIKILFERLERALNREHGADPTSEQASGHRALRRMGVAWDCLYTCASLDPVDLADGPGRILADSAMANFDHPLLRQGALRELADIALASDHPTLWTFCTLHGHDPHVSAEQILGNSYSPPRTPSLAMERSVFGQAIARDAWACVDLLCASPEGRIGVPLATPSHMLSDASSGPTSWRHNSRQAEKNQIARWWTDNHPMLIAWDREASSGDSFSKSIQKKLNKHGYGPRFGDPGFDLAATLAALGGSDSALRACVGAGLSSKDARAACADVRIDPSVGTWFWHLSRVGGLGLDAKLAKKWAAVAEWIDQDVGHACTSLLVQSHALAAIRSASGKDMLQLPKGDIIDLAMSWLAAHGPLDTNTVASERADLQDLMLEVKEEKAKPNTALKATLLQPLLKSISLKCSKKYPLSNAQISPPANMQFQIFLPNGVKG